MIDDFDNSNNKKPRRTYQGQVGEINVDERSRCLKLLADYKGSEN
jgi:aromatic ring hydroxylase